MFTLRLRAFYILSTLRRSASIPRAAATVSKASATELEYSSSPSTRRWAANKTAVIRRNNREKQITIRFFNLQHLADLWPVGCRSAHTVEGGQVQLVPVRESKSIHQSPEQRISNTARLKLEYISIHISCSLLEVTLI